ncbi:MAG: MFS transporter [Anaerolineales bacterium]|nr:MFS transporter [Anaerolineales bacterium]
MNLRKRVTNVQNVYHEFPRPFWVLILATFIDSMGGFLIFPFLSLYITQRFDVGLTEVGIIFGIFAIASVFGSLGGGALSDRFGRKPMLIFGLVASGLSSLIMGFLDNLTLFYLLAGLVGLLSNVGGPARQAMVADLLPEEKQAEGFGLMRVVLNISAAIGPALGGLLASQSFLALFILDAISSLITAVVVYVALPETRPETVVDADDAGLNAESSIGYSKVMRDYAFMAFVFFSILIVSIYIQMNSTLPVYLRDFHDVSAQGYGILLSINALMVVFLQFWITRRISPYSAFRMVALGAALYGVGFFMFGVVSSYFAFILAIVVLTFGEMISAPTSQALAARFSPEDMRGRYMAVFGLGWSLPTAFVPLLAGIIMDNYNPNLVWYLCGMLGVVSVAGMLLLEARTRDRIALGDEPVGVETTPEFET